MSKQDDVINRLLILNSGGANPEDYLTPKQLQRYNDNPERFIDIDIDLVMNKKEEEKRNLWDARSRLRTGLGLGFEVGANSILDLFSFDPTGASQYAGGTFINYLAQKIRGGEISQGELVAAGLTSLIPGGAQARALTRGGRFTRSVAKGGLSGGITTTSMSLLDEGELPSFGEFAGGVGVGGAFGGMFDLAPAAVTGKLGSEASEIASDTGFFLKQLQRRVQGGDLIFDPDVYYGPGFGKGTIGAARNPLRPDDFNLPKGDGEFKIRPETPFYRSLSPRGQDSLKRFARSNLNADSWQDLGLDIKYEGIFDQGDWDGYVQKVSDQQDQTKFIINMMNNIYTEQELKTGDLNEFGVRLADMFGLPEPINSAGLEKIIRNEGGIIYLRTPRMRRNNIPALEITNLQQLQDAIETRLADIAQDPYYEYGHIRAVLNILQDNDAINNANFLNNFQAEPARSIVRSLFKNDLDELLEGPVESVVEELGNRATKAAGDLDLNLNRLEGSAANLEESFINYMKPKFDVANAVPVQLRERLANDYLAEVKGQRSEMLDYGINLDDPNTTFDLDDINLAVFKEVLESYTIGGKSFWNILQLDEFQKVMRIPELRDELLTVRPGTTDQFEINYMSNLNLTSQQRALLDSLEDRINSLAMPTIRRKLERTFQRKNIKKKQVNLGNKAFSNRPLKKRKKKFGPKKDDDDTSPVKK